MCSTQPPMFTKTTHARSRLQTSTRSCFLRLRTIRHQHGKASTSRSSTSPSCRHVLHRSHSSAIFRSTSVSHTAASLRTSFEHTSTSSDARFRYSSDRNNFYRAESFELSTKALVFVDNFFERTIVSRKWRVFMDVLMLDTIVSRKTGIFVDKQFGTAFAKCYSRLV